MPDTHWRQRSDSAEQLVQASIPLGFVFGFRLPTTEAALMTLQLAQRPVDNGLMTIDREER